MSSPGAEILLVLVLAAGVWFWLDGLKAREAGMRAARAACAAEGLQLLDDTVAASGIRARRDDDGRLRLARSFRFEFSDTGDNRRDGSVTVVGTEVTLLNLGLRPAPGGRPSLR